MKAHLLASVSHRAFIPWVQALDCVGPNRERGTFKLG